MGRVSVEDECRPLRGGTLYGKVGLDWPLKRWERKAGPAARGGVVCDCVVGVGDVKAARGNVSGEQQAARVLGNCVNSLAARGACWRAHVVYLFQKGEIDWLEKTRS